MDGPSPEERERSLKLATDQIVKQYGKGAIMCLGDQSRRVEGGVIPTGSMALDVALGVGGIPRGRIVEIYGPESSGKTTLALHIMAEAQALGGRVAIIDAEHAMDPEYAGRLGLNIDELLIAQPDTGEQALEIAEILVRSQALDVVTIDSVAALVPRAEIEGEMGDSHMGLQARLMSQALRKLTGVTSRSRTVLIFINQIREKIGVVFGNPETTTGGRALKFYASMRIEVRRSDSIKKGTDQVGNVVTARVVKNKMAPPFKKAQFDIIFGHGISKAGNVLDLAVEAKLVNKSGSWYTLDEEKLGQGKENARAFLEEHPELLQTLESELRTFYDLSPIVASGVKEDADGEPAAVEAE
ncbi:recombinase RecA [bacterium]|nr:recombinase RecA [bacterium]